MDPASEQLMHALLDGVDQGTTKVVALGTSAAAAAAWHRVRGILQRRHPSPDTQELEVLSAEPGQEVDALLRQAGVGGHHHQRRVRPEGRLPRDVFGTGAPGVTR